MSPGPDIAAVDDGELARRITAAATGLDPAAETELVRRFAPRVRLYGLRHLGTEDRAGELVQRVMILAIEKLRADQIREPDRIASFILGAARMTSREMRRDEHRATPTDVLPELADGYRPPEPLAAEHLERCLESLDERSRAVVMLTYFGEQSAAEIARSLAISEGNVHVVRHRSIARLRDCMELAP